MMKVSLVLFVGLVATALMRRRSAALRHWVLAATIACAAVTPALALVVPAWHMPSGSIWLGRSVEPLTLFVPVRLSQPLDSPDAAPAAAAGAATRLTVAQLLTWIWKTGTAISLSVLLAGLARLAWLASGSRRIDHGLWVELTKRLAHEYGLRQPVRLLQSRHPTLLATWGLRQPKIILPPEALDWPRDRVRIVLGHELAHVARRDWLVQLVAELLRCVYWFNPLAWIACRRLRQESEQACDDAVLALGVDGPEYAGHLLEVARTVTGYQASVFPAPAMARPSSLERRVSAMLNTRLNRRPITRPAGIASFIALVGLTIPIAGLVAAAQSAAAAFSGTLVDAVGRILPNATLVLANAESKQKYEAHSDQAGHFALTGLPAGDYQLQARLPGFATSQGRVTLGSGQILNRDVALQIGVIEETLWIGSRAPAPVPTPARPRETVSQPQFDSCSQSTAGGCISPPRKIANAVPRYPQALIASGTAGNVEVDGRIGTDGFVKDLRVIAPADAELANATVEAVGQWQYTATRLDGVPVETDIHVTAHFAIE
jgi:beta-lactamase regulating signal transducer with metallopeptidase domain